MHRKLFFETGFGKLFFHNIYELPNKHAACSASNEQGQFFFCYSLGLDDKQENKSWLITPITKDDLQRFEQKEMPIINAIMGNEGEKVQLIKINMKNGSREEKWISC